MIRERERESATKHFIIGPRCKKDVKACAIVIGYTIIYACIYTCAIAYLFIHLYEVRVIRVLVVRYLSFAL